MNILYLVNELRYTCGVTNHLIHLTRGVSRQGINLFIIYGGGNGSERFANIKLKLVQDSRFLHEKRSFINFISAVNFLRDLVRREKINIIHSHYHYGANIAYLLSKFTKVCTVQTNHGIIQSKGRLKHFSAERYVAINEHILNYLLENNIADNEDVSFIRCGIPVLDEIIPRTEEKIRFLTASRLVRDKGIDIFIKAISGLSNDLIKKAEFFIAGEGPEEIQLKKLNEDLGNYAKFLGRVNDIYKLLSDVHAFVYPSRSFSEGFPAVITEACACGALVITSRFKGHGPVLDESNSVLFKSENSDELRDIIADVIENYREYHPRTLKLYNKIKEEFSIKEMIEKHIRLYESMLISK